MSVKRIVDTNFWIDDKVVEMFSPEDKYFMLYLLTNPHTTQLGIYQLTPKIASFELGYSTDSVNVLLDRFENKYEILKYCKSTKEVAIKNYLVYSIVKGGKPVEDLLTKEIKQVKSKSLIKYVFNNLYDKDNINITVRSIIDKYNNDNDIHNDNDVSYHDTYHDSCVVKNDYELVLDYLNEKVGTNFGTCKSNVNFIKARLIDYSIDDLKEVIDKKTKEWLGTSMQKYLRPETLFNATKFESYLNGLDTATYFKSQQQLGGTYYDKEDLDNYDDR